jgi:hypothetical protein
MNALLVVVHQILNPGELSRNLTVVEGFAILKDLYISSLFHGLSEINFERLKVYIDLNVFFTVDGLVLPLEHFLF